MMNEMGSQLSLNVRRRVRRVVFSFSLSLYLSVVWAEITPGIVCESERSYCVWDLFVCVVCPEPSK